MIFVEAFTQPTLPDSLTRNFNSTLFPSAGFVNCMLFRLVLCFLVWPCFNRVVDLEWHQLLHLDRSCKPAKISSLFPPFRFCSDIDVGKSAWFEAYAVHVCVLMEIPRILLAPTRLSPRFVLILDSSHQFAHLNQLRAEFKFLLCYNKWRVIHLALLLVIVMLCPIPLASLHRS